jgi:hypothetical protein
MLLVLFGRPTTGLASLAISLSLMGLLTPQPRGGPASPPEVTQCSSLRCRPQTLWCRGCMRTPSPLYCGLDRVPLLADRFIIGAAPVDYGPVFLLMPFGFHLTVDTPPFGELLPADALAPLNRACLQLCTRKPFETRPTPVNSGGCPYPIRTAETIEDSIPYYSNYFM